MASGFALGPDEGTTIAFLGGLATYKISTEDTGSWGLSVETSPAGFGSVLHIHHTEDSGFFILRGRMRVRCGETDIEAGPEAFVFLPRGVPHAFKVVSNEPATWLNIQGPTGDFRRYVEEIGLHIDSPAWPPPMPVRPDPKELSPTAARHKLQIIGPPPFDS